MRTVKSWKINVSFYMSNFKCKHNSFSFQSVIFSLLFIFVVFTLISLVILDSNHWLCLIIIFYVYDSKINFVYAFLFIFIFTVLIDFPSHCFMVSLFVSKHNGLVAPLTLPVVLFGSFFFVSSFPMSVTTRSDLCLHPNYFAER